MSRYGFLPIVALLILQTLWTTEGAKPEVRAQDATRNFQQELAARKQAAFRKARELLMQEGVPFDPDILMSSQWKVRVKPFLNEMSQLQIVRVGERKLKGVQLAHTLYLPENVQLTGDTVILARYLVFSGRNVVIKGNYDIHIFPIDGTIFTDNSSNTERQTKPGLPVSSGLEMKPSVGHLTIDASGPGRDEWIEAVRSKKSAHLHPKRKGVLNSHRTASPQVNQNQSGLAGADGGPGTNGVSGQSGSTGTNGAKGTCGGSINGADGAAGDDGSNGQNGGRGFDGVNGLPGGNISITAETGQTYMLISNGGRGGNGGSGGQGGTGGSGGNGGKGGDGASCTCNGGPGSSGGRGGNGGFGEFGGDGGSGGNGGNGGNGGLITVRYPSGYNPDNISTTSVPGTGGTSGGGGHGGFGGSGGPRGQGGTGASGFSCIGNGNQGQDGNNGTGGNFGDWGTNGSNGANGTSGSIDIAPLNDGCPPYRAYNCNEDLPPPGCAYEINSAHPSCNTPVLVDVSGDGMRLTPGAAGVLFDLDADGVRQAWHGQKRSRMTHGSP